MKSKKKLWFRAKKYGWGWTPVTWEGWLVVIIYVLFISFRAKEVSSMFDTNTSFVFRYFFEVLFSTIPLIIICYLKGEKPRWRWGKK
jgi:ABC-type phosphate/phosphonate transport system permease subunit